MVQTYQDAGQLGKLGTTAPTSITLGKGTTIALQPADEATYLQAKADELKRLVTMPGNQAWLAKNDGKPAQVAQALSTWERKASSVAAQAVARSLGMAEIRRRQQQAKAAA